jgi:hypothetical protein
MVIIFFNSIKISFSREINLFYIKMENENLDMFSTLNNLLTGLTHELEKM